MRDEIVLGLLVVSFATLLTVHTTLAIGLARRRPRWRGIAAFVLAPLAPWWGWKERMHTRGVLWVVAATGYAITLALSLRA